MSDKPDEVILAEIAQLAAGGKYQGPDRRKEPRKPKDKDK